MKPKANPTETDPVPLAVRSKPHFRPSKGLRLPSAPQIPPLDSVKSQKIKVGLVEFIDMDFEEKARHIVDAVQQERSSPLKKGVGRFESILEVFGFKSEIKGEHIRDLLELQQVRNLYVHRRGIIDKKFVECCPWLNAREGDYLHISEENLVRYFDAVDKYFTSVITRVADAHDGFKAKVKENKLVLYQDWTV